MSGNRFKPSQHRFAHFLLFADPGVEHGQGTKRGNRLGCGNPGGGFQRGGGVKGVARHGHMQRGGHVGGEFVGAGGGHDEQGRLIARFLR